MEIIRDLATFRPPASPVVALGNFDGVHLGHQAILKVAIARAKEMNGSAFALTFDPLPAKILAPAHAPQLLLTPEDKIEMLRRSGVNGVIVIEFTLAFSKVTPRSFAIDYLLGRIGARGVIVGHSVSFGHNRDDGAWARTRVHHRGRRSRAGCRDGSKFHQGARSDCGRGYEGGRGAARP
jgi:riboflavin kinase / FMN adenylyltransferase